MKSLSTKIGIFASSVLVTVAAVYLYSPVIGSYADSNSSTQLSAIINPVASITLDTNNLVFNLVPTEEGTFGSQPITATVQTNSRGGYELYFSSVDDDTDMIHSDDSIDDVISSSFWDTVTSSTMHPDTWGYSLDDTDFYEIPYLSDSTKIKDIDHFPETSEKSTPVYIGIKISSGIPSGTYSKTVMFSAIAHDDPIPTWNITNMQDMTPAVCKAAVIGTTGTLTDTRDGNTYTVAKLKDGKCWMTQNLSIMNKTITSADSDLPDNRTYTIPARDFENFTGDYDNDAVYSASDYGSYYSFYTATAGWADQNIREGNAPISICPKGWRLPTGGSTGDYSALYAKYNSSALMQGEPGFTLGGFISNYYGDWGEVGYYWTATVKDINTAYRLSLDNSSVHSLDSTYARSDGFAVRCVARESQPTMQSFDKTTLVNTGDSVTLQDVRDGNLYTVKKLADGNVWMTQNLRIVNKTITSNDSDLPNGESYTIPASSLSNFTTAYNTSAAYAKPAYEIGSYYNFYTATAGFGTSSVTSGNSSKSICPKGWRLPTGGNISEFSTLYENYSSEYAMKLSDPGFINAVFVYNGSDGYSGPIGQYWSSTVIDADNVYNLRLNSSDVDPAYSINKYYGISVRCIAK